MLIARAMWVLRRLVATMLAATLMLAGPLGAPRTCSDCPPDCPMHAEDGGHGRAKGQPGCHRTPEPVPPGTVCLRSDCGHEATTESLTVLTLLVPPLALASPAPGPRIVTPAPCVASLDAPEPLPHPPRRARA